MTFTTILMLHIDMFMQSLILHWFYECCSHQTFMVHIDDLVNMLIFIWFHDYWIVHHFNFMSFLLLGLAVPQGAL